MRFKKIFYGRQSVSWSDIWRVVKVLRSPFITQGPNVEKLEKIICNYTGAKYTVVVSSGTAALHLSMLSLGISRNDEVITSPNTFLATANCVLYVGGTIKFADIELSTGCIDPQEIEKQITSNTRAMIPVHFAGQVCDMKEIFKIAKKYNLFVVEDAAHAVGSRYLGKKVGCCEYSDMTIFSFHPVKNMTTGEGGAITTNDKKNYEKIKMLRSHGIVREENVLIKDKDPWYYEMHYLGFNYRMTDIQAVLGMSQLKRLDGFIKRRREIVDMYKEKFSGDGRFSFLEEKKYSKAAFHLCPLLINFEKVGLSKKDIFKKLEKMGLHLQVHFIPVHFQPFYRQFGFKKGDYPRAEKYYEQTLSLPLYPDLKNKEIDYIVSAIKEVII